MKQLVAELSLKNRVLTPALAGGPRPPGPKGAGQGVPGKKACWVLREKRCGKTNTCTCAASAGVRRSAAEKREIIELVEHSALSTNKTLAELGVPRSTFYTWCKQYRAQGAAGLEPRTSTPRQFPLALPLRDSAGRVWNRIPDQVNEQIIQLALANPEKSPRQLAWQFIAQHPVRDRSGGLFRLGIKRFSLAEAL